MTDLLETIFKCDLREIENSFGANVNYRIPNTEGCTILHIMAGIKKFDNKEKVLSYLLAKGANPNIRSKDYLTPVHIAAMWNNCSELDKLLQNGEYCPEVYNFLHDVSSLSKIQNYIDMMVDEFNKSITQTKWREGGQKCCFNYFLLDPRVTQNLPIRHNNLTFEQMFHTFLDAIFYVGKGTKGRPHNHLLDAIKALEGLQSITDKINHILDIWSSGYGVISLHCFNNCIPVEAYTNEACIIEAIGLENLTNVKAGDYYGQVAKEKKSLKRQIGISLLNRALRILIYEGEKQIKPKDLQKK